MGHGALGGRPEIQEETVAHYPVTQQPYEGQAGLGSGHAPTPMEVLDQVGGQHGQRRQGQEQQTPPPVMGIAALAFGEIKHHAQKDQGQTKAGEKPEKGSAGHFQAVNIVGGEVLGIDQPGGVEKNKAQKKGSVQAGDQGGRFTSVPHRFPSPREIEGKKQICGYHRKFTDSLKASPENLGIKGSGGQRHALAQSPQSQKEGHTEEENVHQLSASLEEYVNSSGQAQQARCGGDE